MLAKFWTRQKATGAPATVGQASDTGSRPPYTHALNVRLAGHKFLQFGRAEEHDLVEVCKFGGGASKFRIGDSDATDLDAFAIDQKCRTYLNLQPHVMTGKFRQHVLPYLVVDVVVIIKPGAGRRGKRHEDTVLDAPPADVE